MIEIGKVLGAGLGGEHDGSVRITVTDEWNMALDMQGEDGGRPARVVLTVDPGPNSISELARLCLEAEHRVVELSLEAQAANNSSKFDEMRNRH